MYPLCQPHPLHAPSVSTSSTPCILCVNLIHSMYPLSQSHTLHAPSVSISYTPSTLCVNLIHSMYPVCQPHSLHVPYVSISYTPCTLCVNLIHSMYPLCQSHPLHATCLCTVVRAGCEQGRHESEGSTAPLYCLERAVGRRMTVPRESTHSMHPAGTIHTGHY